MMPSCEELHEAHTRVVTKVEAKFSFNNYDASGGVGVVVEIKSLWEQSLLSDFLPDFWLSTWLFIQNYGSEVRMWLDLWGKKKGKQSCFTPCASLTSQCAIHLHTPERQILHWFPAAWYLGDSEVKKSLGNWGDWRDQTWEKQYFTGVGSTPAHSFPSQVFCTQ